MKPHSKTDWERVKREAAMDAPVPFDPETDLYNPNDEAAVTEFIAKAKVSRGRPAGSAAKEQVAIRFDKDVLAAFRADGPGWQTRMNNALRQWLKEHSAA